MKRIEFITAKLTNDGTLTKDEMATIITAVFSLNIDFEDRSSTSTFYQSKLDDEVLSPIKNGLVSLNQEIQ